MLALQPPATVPVVFFALKGKGSAGVVRPRQRACTQSPVRASLSWHARCHGGCVSEGRKSGDWSALTRFPESCAAFAEVCEWVRTDERLITILQTVQMVSAQTCSRSQRSLLEPSGRCVGLQCQRIACRAPEQKSSRIHHQTSWELWPPTRSTFSKACSTFRSDLRGRGASAGSAAFTTFQAGRKVGNLNPPERVQLHASRHRVEVKHDGQHPMLPGGSTLNNAEKGAQARDCHGRAPEGRGVG